jgi:hypothetical protein
MARIILIKLVARVNKVCMKWTLLGTLRRLNAPFDSRQAREMWSEPRLVCKGAQMRR